MAEFINELKYGDIAKYGRRGDTMIAHINPNEAAMLKRMGGAGTINPMTGLPEFYYGSYSDSGFDDTGMTGTGSTDGGTGGNEGSGDGPDIPGGPEESNVPGITFDAGLSDEETFDQGVRDTAEKFGISIPEAYDMLGPAGVGRGGPGEFIGLGGPQRSGTDLANDLYEKNRTAYNLAYTNYIKANPGNPEGFAGFLGSLGEEGVADFVNAVNTGYRFGGPEGTLADILEGRTSALNKAAAKKRKEQEKADKEAEGPFDEPGEFQAEPEPGFFGFIGDVLSSLNPLAELTPQEKGVLQSYENLGLTVRERSTMDNLIGFGANLAMPGPLSALKFIGEKATGASIIGLATDPATGLDYLVQANGDLQLASDQLGDLSPQDGGNESIIPKKREAVTEAPKEEEEEEEVKAAEKEKIKPSAYQEYLADLLYPNTSDSLTRNV